MADNKKSPIPVGGGRGDRHAATQKPKNTVATLKKLWKYISVHKVKLIIVFFLVLFTTLTTFVYVDEEGVVKNISPYASGMEVEDMDCRNGQMYMAVNRKGKVEIYSLSSLPFSVNV